ncbi:MAG: class I SAM-dependent DNA methyltransferase [Sumerlaeia bacterium]
MPTPAQIDAFIDRWSPSGGSERGNYQSFLSELCTLLDVPPPDPAVAKEEDNAYVFDRAVTMHHPGGSTSTGYADLYRRGCFVCETKQGVEANEAQAEALARSTAAAKRKQGHGKRGSATWDSTMLKAKGQAQGYARELPASEGRPPFLLVVDIGYCFDLYAEFSRSGGSYTPFPDARSHRLYMADLHREDVRDTLRAIWLDPMALDPSRRSAKVTRDIAERLARLARSLETAGNNPADVAHFLMRCLFTMFAEDVDLLPDRSFRDLLEGLRGDLPAVVPALQALWHDMDAGGYCATLRRKILCFNGGLFREPSALPLTRDELELLIEAAAADWRDVEPAIFGTLLERALSPIERHKLGAHYTPRAYVERLVMPTVINPLREEWDAVQAAATALADDDQQEEAAKIVRAFHDRLCETRILDPACGSGNFLYVTLDHMKRLEGEVLSLLEALGHGQLALSGDHFTVDPRQFLGIEVNPRAAAIAELVLWIGYLQWVIRTPTPGGQPEWREPIIRDFHNIQCRDAVLAWDATEPDLDPATGAVRTRWDGRTFKRHPVTGEQVPDETARIELQRYVNPRPAEWPEAEFIVGNPPFIGGKDLRASLGDGYAEALWAAHRDMPESADFVLYWWDEAARLVRTGEAERFGFITTNSLRQVFNRRVIDRHLSDKKAPLSILYAVPDHPWVSAADGAAVRIAMTVCSCNTAQDGKLEAVVSELWDGKDHNIIEVRPHFGRINAALTIDVEVWRSQKLLSNSGLALRGVTFMGAGFLIDELETKRLAGGNTDGVIKPTLNGKDVVQRERNMYCIDLYNYEENVVISKFPGIYQHLRDSVFLDRKAKIGRSKDADAYFEKWWVFAKPRPELRVATSRLHRFIVTTMTAKHRIFVFQDSDVIPDQGLVVIAVEIAEILGVLSSKYHIAWTLASGGTLEDRPRYNNSVCFDPFPFPDPTEAQRARIRDLGERLDAHRKARQAEHPDLTLTAMYNALEALRAGRELTKKERDAYDKGLVAVLKQIHDDLDAAVAEAYGWPADLPEDEVLERLVALNQERAAEEAQGKIRWLRPEYQAPGETDRQTELAVEADEAELQPAAPAPKPKDREPWPKTLPEQAQAIRRVLASAPAPLSVDAVAKHFKRAPRDRVAELLDTLASLGQARRVGDGGFAGQ